nr:sulfotransferase [Paracoccus laeviglucosivorans]
MNNPNRPDIFIVGTMKGGTTILHEFLGHHPEIHPGRDKEIHYFSLYEAKGLAWYHQQFEGLPPNQHYMDASPTYFDMAAAPTIPSKIDAYNPQARIVMLARHPIDRALSHFNHVKKVNKAPGVTEMTADEFFSRPIEHAISGTSAADIYHFQTLEFSCYYRKAIHYKRIFGDRFMVVDNANLSAEPQETMNRIFRHVQVDPITSDAFGQRKYSHMKKDSAVLSPKTRERLSEMFKPNYRAFCNVVGLEFKW